MMGKAKYTGLWHRLVKYLLCIALWSGSAAVWAENAKWTWVGPETQEGMSIAVDSGDGRVVYVGTSFNRLFISEDGGLTWRRDASYRGRQSAWWVRADPEQAGTVQAISEEGVLYRRRSGGSWSRAAEQAPSEAYGEIPVVGSGDAPILYMVISNSALRVSRDNGVSWEFTGVETVGRKVTVARIDPLNPDVAYVGTEDRGVFRSDDQGRTWQSFNEGLASANVVGLAVAGDDSRLIYSGTGEGAVYRRVAGEGQWERLGVFTADPVYRMASRRSGTQVVYASAWRAWFEIGLFTRIRLRSGVYESRDGGRKWAPQGRDERYLLGVSPADSTYELAMAFSKSRPYDSTVDGPELLGLRNYAVKAGSRHINFAGKQIPGAIAFDPSDPDAAYIGINAEGVAGAIYKSADRGANWERIGQLPIGWRSLDIEPPFPDPLMEVALVRRLALAGPGTFLAAPASRVYKSEDNGMSWRQVGGEIDKLVSQIIASPHGGREVYAIAEDELFYSADSGESWVSLLGSTGVMYRVLVDPRDPQVLYVGTEEGFRFSADQGETWREWDAGLTVPPVYDMVFVTEPEPRLLAGTALGVFSLDLAALGLAVARGAVLAEMAADEGGEAGMVSVVAEEAAAVPMISGLAPSYPNPFNGATAIPFRLVASGMVDLAVYDVAGRQVRSLVAGVRAAGMHRAVWDGRDDAGRAVASGLYIARLRTPQGVQSGKMVLLR